MYVIRNASNERLVDAQQPMYLLKIGRRYLWSYSMSDAYVFHSLEDADAAAYKFEEFVGIESCVAVCHLNGNCVDE